MAWIEPQRLPLLASGVAMMLLAAALVAIDFSKRANRAFAAFLALRGMTISLYSLNLGLAGERAIVSFVPFLSLSLVPLTLYFASIYPRPRGPLSKPGMGWLVVGIIAVLDLVYLVSHGSYQQLSTEPAATAMQVASRNYSYVDFGPLAVIGFALSPLMALTSLLFVRDYVQSQPGTQRTSYFLVAAGFLVNAAFDGTRQSVGLVRLIQDGGDFPWLPWGWAFAVLPALSLLPALAGFALIGKHRFAQRGDEQRREGLLFALALLAILTGLSPLLLPSGSEFFRHPSTLVLLGLWRLTLPIFVSYALLRYALFDIDLKVRAAVAGSVVVVIGAAGYFLVSELLEGQVAARFGNLGGLVAAGLFTLVAGPLAGAGKKVSRFIMPGVHDVQGTPKLAALDIYRQQYLMLQEDGSLTAKERASLDSLRERLGLAKAAARSAERNVSAS